MIKLSKILCVLSIYFLLFLAFDIAFFYYVRSQQFEIIKSQQEYYEEKLYLPHYFVKLNKFSDYYKSIIKHEERPIMNFYSKENPIVIFGCSYAQGYIFENEETISYVFSKYSKRPIYNRARNSWGIQHMLYQLQNDKEMLEQIKNPKYVFYVLIEGIGHFERLYCTNFPNIMEDNYYFTYKVKNGKLVERKPLFGLYYGFSIFRHIYNKIILSKIYKNLYIKPNKKLFDFFILHFKNINELIKEKWGEDTKFIILTFEDTQREYWQPQLEKEGIEVIDIAETIGIKELRRKELGFFEPEIAGHPNGRLWQALVPKLKEIYPDL